MTSRALGTNRSVAVVEDDESIGTSVVVALETNGFDASWYRDGVTASAALDRGAPDLVLLDAGLPDLDGFSLCRQLRERYAELPIVIVTARDSEIDMIVGLDAGATDYVTKPFSMDVLLARVRAHLRTVTAANPTAPIVVGPLTVEPAAYKARLWDDDIDLRPREFELLVFLARHAGHVVSREQILTTVWNLHWESATKTVDMHLSTLRRKLLGGVEITNVRGVGYRLETQ